MLNYKENEEYNSIIDNIVNHKEFRKIEGIKHHNTNRLDHSFKVSYYSYKISKKLNLDYIEVARAGLLHDFYLEQISDLDTFKEKLKLFSVSHPIEAYENASKYFILSDKEKDIILTHMFPMSNKMPSCKESWLVSLVDKGVSVCEFSTKFSCELKYATNFLFLFLFNLILK